MEDAAGRVAEINAKGLEAIVNVLGENHTDQRDVETAVREYRALASRLGTGGFDAGISVKATQLGLSIDYGYCRAQTSRVLDACRSNGLYLWFDMESSRYTDDTLRLYLDALAQYPRSGVCLQANLRRTRADLDRIIRAGGHVRLTKGAYRENASIAYRRGPETDASILGLTETLFRSGDRFAIATHDDRVIDKARTLNREIPRTFEFQFLLGVRDSLKQELVSRGYRVVEYVPYGPGWLPYFARRLRERPRNVITMVRSFVGG